MNVVQILNRQKRLGSFARAMSLPARSKENHRQLIRKNILKQNELVRDFRAAKSGD